MVVGNRNCTGDTFKESCCPFYARGIFTGKEPNRKSEKPFGGAAERNRTAISWLEARCSADELQPRVGREA